MPFFLVVFWLVVAARDGAFTSTTGDLWVIADALILIVLMLDRLGSWTDDLSFFGIISSCIGPCHNLHPRFIVIRRLIGPALTSNISSFLTAAARFGSCDFQRGLGLPVSGHGEVRSCFLCITCQHLHFGSILTINSEVLMAVLWWLKICWVTSNCTYALIYSSCCLPLRLKTSNGNGTLHTCWQVHLMGLNSVTRYWTLSKPWSGLWATDSQRRSVCLATRGVWLVLAPIIDLFTWHADKESGRRGVEGSRIPWVGSVCPSGWCKHPGARCSACACSWAASRMPPADYWYKSGEGALEHFGWKHPKAGGWTATCDG